MPEDLHEYLNRMLGSTEEPTTAPVKRADIPALARSYAEKHGVDPDIFERQIKQESGFNPFARSPKGARGVAQFMPETGGRYGLHKDRDFYDPHKSLEAGARHMKDLLDEFGGDYEKVLAAYNAGPRRAQDGSYKRIAETRNYIASILGKPVGGGKEDLNSYLNRMLPAAKAQSALGNIPKNIPPARPSPNMTSGAVLNKNPKGDVLTWDGYPAIKNSDGSLTTERSITVTDSRLNNGKPTNIPTIWGGRQVNDAEAIKRAATSGVRFPSFGSIDEAVTIARQRSEAKGREIDSPEHPLYTAALSEVMQSAGIGEQMARAFLASKLGKRKYPNLPMPARVEAQNQPAINPTAAIPPVISTEAPPIPENISPAQSALSGYVPGSIPNVQPVDRNLYQEDTSAIQMQEQLIAPESSPKVASGAKVDQLSPQTAITATAKPTASTDKMIRVFGLDRKSSTPEEIKQRVLESIGFSPEDAAQTPFEIRTPNPTEHINAHTGDLSFFIPKNEYEYLKRSADESKRKQDLAGLMPRLPQLLKVINSADIPEEDRAQLQNYVNSFLGNLQQPIAEPPAPTPPVQVRPEDAGANALIAAMHDPNPQGKERSPLLDLAHEGAADLVAGGFNGLSRIQVPFTTAASGILRGAGTLADWAYNKATGDEEGATQARKALDHYGLSDMADATWHAIKTGEAPPGYEVGAAIVARELAQRGGIDPDSQLGQFIYHTASIAGDPTTYIGPELLLGKIAQARKPLAVIKEELAAADLARAIAGKTAKAGEAARGLSTAEKATAGVAARATEEIHPSLVTEGETARSRPQQTVDHQFITTEDIKPNDNQKPISEPLRSEVEASTKAKASAAAEEEVSKFKQAESDAEEMAKQKRAEFFDNEKARAQKGATPAEPGTDSSTATQSAAPAPLSREETASISSERLQDAIGNAPAGTRKSLESLKATNTMLDGGRKRKASIESIANLESRQADLLAKPDVRKALDLPEIKGRRASELPPIMPEPELRKNPANKVSGKVQGGNEALSPPANNIISRESTEPAQVEIPEMEAKPAIELASPKTASEDLQSQFDQARKALDDLNIRKRKGENVGREIIEQSKVTKDLATQLRETKSAESNTAKIESARVDAEAVFAEKKIPRISELMNKHKLSYEEARQVIGDAATKVNKTKRAASDFDKLFAEAQAEKGSPIAKPDEVISSETPAPESSPDKAVSSNPEQKASPYAAKTMEDLITPKQMTAVRKIANEKGIDYEAESLSRYGLPHDQLSKKTGIRFISDLKKMEARFAEPTVTIVKNAPVRDAAQGTGIKPDDSLTTAVVKLGGVDPRTPEGSDIAKYLQGHEGGRPGAMNKAGRGVDEVITQLREHGWDIETPSDLVEAVRHEQKGRRVYSTEHDFDKDFDRQYKEAFGKDKQITVEHGTIRDVAKDLEASRLLSEMSAGEATDEQLARFEEIAKYQYNVRDKDIRAIRAEAIEARASLRGDELPDSQLAESRSGGSEPSAARKQSEAVNLPAKNLTRNFRAGNNSASITFDSELQRDLYDYGANKFGSAGSKNPRPKAKSFADIEARLKEQFGDDQQALLNAASDVRNDVRAQMKGVKDGEARTVVDNVNATRLTTEQVDRVRALHKSLTEQGTPVEDYLKQQGLFGEEINPAQRDLLREIDSKQRRAPNKSEQTNLLKTKPTPESEAAKRAEIYDRLKKRLESERGSGGPSAETVSDLAQLAASYVREGGAGYRKWLTELQNEFGLEYERMKPHLLAAWKAAKDAAETESKDALKVGKQEPLIPDAAKPPERNSPLEIISAMRKSGLLTGVKTTLKNVGSNLIMQVMENGPTRALGSVADIAMSAVTKRRTLTGVSLRAEAKAGYDAATKGVKEAWEIIKKGAPEAELEKIANTREINSGSKILDTYINGPFRFMTAQDRVFKSYAFTRSLEDRALAMAKTEARAGKLKMSARERAAQIVKEAKAGKREDLAALALSDAEIATFNNSNKFGQTVQAAREKSGKLGAFAIDMALPFSTVPANVVARSLDYAGFGVPKEVVKAIIKRSFTPEQQRAFAQQFGRAATGAPLIALGWKLSESGQMTGIISDKQPERDADEATGRIPGAIRVNGKWRQVMNFSPLGTLLTLGATLQEEHAKEASSKGRMIKRGAEATIFAHPLAETTKEIGEAVSRGDFSRTGRSLAGSIVPSLVADAAAAGDTKARKVESPLDAIKARVPGLRNTLPVKRDAFGREIEQPRSSAVDPFRSTTAKEQSDPVIGEMVRVGANISKEKAGENKDIPARGEKVYNAIKILILSSAYKNAPDHGTEEKPGKREMIQKQISKIRAAETQKTNPKKSGGSLSIGDIFR